jgi:hypothetical protein
MSNQYNRNNATLEDSFESVDTSARLESIRKTFHRRSDETLGTFPSSEIEVKLKALLEGITAFFKTTMPGTTRAYGEAFAYEDAYKQFFNDQTQMVEGGFERSTLSFDEARTNIENALKERGDDTYVWVIHVENIYGAGSCLFDQDRVPFTTYSIMAQVPVFSTGLSTPWVVSNVTATITNNGWTTDRDLAKTTDGVFPANEDI